MVTSIIFLYITTTINFSLNWELRQDVILGSGSIWLISNAVLEVPTSGSETSGISITAVMSTVIADSIMVCATLMANLNINLVLYKLDLALLDGLGTTLACSSGSYPLSYFWIW